MTTLKITLSDRRPVSIETDQWPVISEANDHDGKVECQANTLYRIKVREHSDGRRIVYAIKESGNGGQYAGWHDTRGGFLLPARGSSNEHEYENETVRAIRRCGGLIDRQDLADECIGDLPAVELA